MTRFVNVNSFNRCDTFKETIIIKNIKMLEGSSKMLKDRVHQIPELPRNFKPEYVPSPFLAE